MKVAFLRPEELGAPAKHIRALVNALKLKGVAVKEFIIKEDNVQEIVSQIEEWKPMALMDINTTGLIVGERDGKKYTLADLMGIVQLTFFIDDPLLFFPPLLDVEKPRNYVAFITDLKHTDSLRSLKIENISYVTPFVDKTVFPEQPKEKEIEVAFLGPVIDPQIIVNAVSQNYPQEILPIFFETGEFMFRNPEVHVITAINYVLGLFNPQFQETFNKWKENNRAQAFRLVNDIAAYTTMRRRMYLLNFLDGIELKIIGDFQGELKEGHEVIKPGSHEELLEIYGKSGITIYVSSQTTPTGIGFIPLEAMYMGSAVMIDFKGTIPGFFAPEEEIITFAPLDRADLEEKILFYLENKDATREIAQKGQKAVQEKFTEKDRAEFVYGILQDIYRQFEAAIKSQQKGGELEQ